MSAHTYTHAGGYPPSYYAARPGHPSKQTILRAIHAGEIVSTFDGYRWLIAPADFDAWMGSRLRLSPATVEAADIPAAVRDWVDGLVAVAPRLSPAQVQVVVQRLREGLVGGAAA